MKLGIHASVRHGFMRALAEAAQLGCHTVQIFPRRPGNPFRLPALPEVQELNRFRELHSIYPLAVHSVFQPNIASSNFEVWRRSRDSLAEELQFANLIGAEYLVIHSGNYSPDSTPSLGIKKSAQTVRQALEDRPSETKILIENVAGGDRRLGGNFEQLFQLLSEVGLENKTGICFDTAHAFAAGYPIQTEAGMEDCFALFDKTIGLKHLKLFHLNDSSGHFSSHRDIHQHIGQGLIGLKMLRKLAADPRFVHLPGILETPKLPLGSDRKNLDQLRNRS